MNNPISISNNTLDKEMKILLSLIGVLIVEYPKKVHTLLSDFDIRVTDSLREESIVEKVLYAIAHKGEAFQMKLSELIESLFTKELKAIYLPEEDGFIGFVVGAVKGVSKLVKKVKKSGQNNQAANNQILASMYEQRQKVALEKQRLIQEKDRIRKIKIGGIVIGLSLLGLVLFKPIKQYYSRQFNQPRPTS